MMSYNKLKFDKGKEVHPELIITMAAFDLGWDLAIKQAENKNDIITGMAVGTKEYLGEIFK